MAQFRAIIEGSRGPASRLGGKASGIYAEAHGWDSGVDVHGDATDDGDVFTIYAHGGNSNGRPGRGYIGKVYRAETAGGLRLIFEDMHGNCREITD